MTYLSGYNGIQMEMEWIHIKDNYGGMPFFWWFVLEIANLHVAKDNAKVLSLNVYYG